MKIENPVKAVLAVLGMVCITLLMALNRVNTEAGLPVISAIVGYSIGNGMAVKAGQESTSIIGKKNK